MRTGRPKRSEDETRVCPGCGRSFTVPAWDERKYCDRACYGKAKLGKPQPERRRGETKRCPVCNRDFYVPPSRVDAECCSYVCAAAKRSGTKHDLREMTSEQVAWLAGVFDGEGCIAIARRDQVDPKSIRITVTNTCEALLLRIREVTGVGTIIARPSKNPRHADCWVWQTYTVTALALLSQMRPWLFAKAERADEALAGRRFPRQSRWDGMFDKV